MTQKELFIVYDGDSVYFADSNDYRNCNAVVPQDKDIEDDTIEGYVKAIAQSHPEYRNFIETHFNELCEKYKRTQHTASMESASVQLDRLEADMYAGGGYGEDGANQRTEHQISRLKTILDSEGEKNMEKTPFIDVCLSGDATLSELDSYVEYWHTHETGNSLQAFLGLTDFEYEQYVKSSDAILKDILLCRQKNISYENYVRLSNSEKNNDFKIEANYNANVLFETSVAVNGQSYLVIYGEHINGNFCCIPGYGWGCEMAEPSDVFYNSRSLSNCGAPEEIAQALAKAIEEHSKEPVFSQIPLTNSERALAEQMKTDAMNRYDQNKLSVLYIAPNQLPRTIKIDNSLEAMQALVGGKIIKHDPFSDNAVFVGNSESLIKGLPFNRAFYDDENDKETRKLIFGSFFICYAPPESENLLSLPSELEEKYSKIFKYPERFYIADNKVKIEKIKPTQTSPELI